MSLEAEAKRLPPGLLSDYSHAVFFLWMLTNSLALACCISAAAAEASLPTPSLVRP